MHLKQTRHKSGKTSLSIVESWWDPKKKCTRQRTIKNLGYAELLEEKHPDPVVWGKALAKQMTEEKRASEQAIEVKIYPKQKIDMRTTNEKNIGSAIVLSAYSALGVQTALRSATRNQKFKYDINAILRLLVCERIVNPGSKLSAWQNRDKYFFRCNFSQSDVYRSLGVLAGIKDKIISAMNRSIEQAGARDLSAVYYDVTNYFFEIDKEDDLRRKGVSKEHRTSPIVQMGLLQDKNGIPLTYKLFAGNTNDCQTLISVLNDIKCEQKLKRIVTVADKGLNSSANIAACVASGNGFVFSQSIRGTKSGSTLRKWVLSEDGYNDSKSFKIKSMQGYKTVHLKPNETDSGKAKDVEVDVKYVAFWSEKYARRARKEREKVLAKAHDLINNPGAYNKTNHFGAAGYIKNIHFDKTTGEVIDTHKLVLDEDAIKRDAAMDGYYVIVTSETDWSDERILNTYRELWRIEETFKVTKSELKTRPVYVSVKDHIEAHFLTCYIALVILRLLQYVTGFSCKELKTEISEMNCINFDANWWTCARRTTNSDKIVSALGLEDLMLKHIQTKDAKAIISKALKWKLPHRK